MIDKFTSIIKNTTDSTVCDLQFIPQDQKLIAISPTSLSLIDLSVPNNLNILSTYKLTEKSQNEHGVFISSACLSIKEFAVLTSKGRIARFNTDNSMQISLFSFSIPRNSYYTCLTQYSHKYYVAGDEKGHFVILSADLSIVYIKNFFDSSIKSICTSHSYGFILLTDCQLYSFKINSNSIEKSMFDLELYPETDFSEITLSKICISNEFNTSAVYDPKGVLYIVSKSDDMSNCIQKITNLQGLLTMSFSNSENLLILVFKEKIGIWNSYYRRIFYVYLPEIQIANCVTISNKFVALSMNKGIAIYPLIHRSHSTVPLMFSCTKIFEFIPTSDSILANEHEISLPAKQDDSNFIEFASADKYSKFIAITTKHRIFIYNRNSQHIKLIAEKLPLIREIEWFSRFLCVLTFDPSKTSFNLVFIKTKKNSSEFQLDKTVKLPSRPFHIRSNNDDKLLVSFYKSILIFDKELNQTTLKMPGYLEEIYPHEHFIFALFSPKVGHRNLISITYDGQVLNLKENVDSFYISHKFDLLFALSGTDIFITSTSHIRFTIFICTDSFPVGVTIPNSICAFITLKNNSSKLDPSLSFFFDYAISTNEHFSSEKKKKALMALNANDRDNKKAIILQSSVFLLRQKKGADCVSFVSNFPDLFNEVLINALRCVESDERKDVYKFVGSPSSYFASLTGTEIVKFDAKTIRFREREGSDARNEEFRLAALLLPVILEDEGFTVAFPAAFFLISRISRFGEDKSAQRETRSSSRAKGGESKSASNSNGSNKSEARNARTSDGHLKESEGKSEAKNANSNNDSNKSEAKNASTSNGSNNKAKGNDNNNNEARNASNGNGHAKESESKSEAENSNNNNDSNKSGAKNASTSNDQSSSSNKSEARNASTVDDRAKPSYSDADDFEYGKRELDALSSFFRFIDPILGHVSALDPDHVSVLGSPLDNSVYTELTQQYEDVVVAKLRAQMACFRPVQMARLAAMCRYSAHYFLSENKGSYSGLFLDDIVRNLKEDAGCYTCLESEGESEGEIGKGGFEGDLENAVDLFRRVGLKMWELALLVKAGKNEDAKKAAEGDSELLEALKKSEFHEIFGL